MNRQEQILMLESTKEFDICVIGGGATGLGIAVDAASRGCKTVLLEKYDFAKATWVQKEKEWHVYWMRANGKWYRYSPLKSVVNLQRFIIEIDKDPYGCFRG